MIEYLNLVKKHIIENYKVAGCEVKINPMDHTLFMRIDKGVDGFFDVVFNISAESDNDVEAEAAGISAHAGLIKR